MPRYQAAFGEVPHDGLEHARRHGKIEEAIVLLFGSRLLDLGQPNLDGVVRGGVARIAPGVEGPLRQPVPHLVVDVLHLVRLTDRGAHLLPKRLIGLRGLSPHREHGEPRREQMLRGELVQRGKELPLCQVTGGTEDHHGAMVGARRCGRSRPEVTRRSNGGFRVARRGLVHEPFTA